MQGVNELLEQADIRMFQLEEPFLEELVENAPPERHTSTLNCIVGKVDLVTLPGNHFYDFGDPGVRDTMAWCDRNGIIHAGKLVLTNYMENNMHGNGFTMRPYETRVYYFE